MDPINHENAAQGDAPSATRLRAVVVVAVLILVAVVVAGWRFRSGAYPLELGKPVDVAEAVALADVLSSDEPPPTGRIVLRGKVGEVCLSAGCWFVLQEVRDGRLREVFVDLAKDGTFTVRGDASGRAAWVSGKLVGKGPDMKFEADGLRLE